MTGSYTKTRPEGMQISLVKMLWWVLPAAAVLWGAGAWPMWHWARARGLAAHSAGGGVVVAAMLVSGAVVKLSARGGPTRAAFAFMAAGLVRIVVCAGIIVALKAALDLPTGVLCVSTPAFYLATLIAEGVWLSRALSRDAAMVAIGRIRRPGRVLPSDIQHPDPEPPGAGREHRVAARRR